MMFTPGEAMLVIDATTTSRSSLQSSSVETLIMDQLILASLAFDTRFRTHCGSLGSVRGDRSWQNLTSNVRTLQLRRTHKAVYILPQRERDALRSAQKVLTVTGRYVPCIREPWQASER